MPGGQCCHCNDHTVRNAAFSDSNSLILASLVGIGYRGESSRRSSSLSVSLGSSNPPAVAYSSSFSKALPPDRERADAGVACAGVNTCVRCLPGLPAHKQVEGTECRLQWAVLGIRRTERPHTKESAHKGATKTDSLNKQADAGSQRPDCGTWVSCSKTQALNVLLSGQTMSRTTEQPGLRSRER